MSRLITSPQVPDPDAFYAALMETLRGMDAAASLRFCARLVLLLANHIGDEEVLRDALQCAREATDPTPSAAPSGAASSRDISA